MWARIDLDTFSVRQTGFVSRSSGGRAVLASDTLSCLDRVEELAHSEYGVAIEIDSEQRRIRFGRDYLGQFPLLYAVSGSTLLIGDEFRELRAEMLRDGRRLSVSEEALALYFTMGYVPQGMTLFEQIIACRNATLYEWSAGSVKEIRLFRPVEVDPGVVTDDLAAAIDGEVARWCNHFGSVDVWCSGGIDSSIVASSAARQAKLSPRILTADYETKIREQYGSGEIPYAQAIAEHLGIPLTQVVMSRDAYAKAFETIVSAHMGPVIDLAILPKHILARSTRNCALTGEGGDPLFAGVKNTPFLFLHQNDPRRPLGYHYAVVHSRFFHKLKEIFVRGAELEAFVTEYFNRLFDDYPGDTLRKLFYLNTFEKQGGLIFAENYYAAKRAGVSARHPLTARSVYEMAFALPDEAKYRYPDGKLALIAAFGSQLPRPIVDRRKSGTILHLRGYQDSSMSGDRLALEAVRQVDGIRSEAIDSMSSKGWRDQHELEIHAWMMLDQWLALNNGGANERLAGVSGASGSYQ